jgi:hypothetical protein
MWLDRACIRLLTHPHQGLESIEVGDSTRIEPKAGSYFSHVGGINS